jgi:hypothetical protein
MHAFLVPRRLRLAGFIVLGIAAMLTAFGGSSVRVAHADVYSTPLCVLHPQLCTEVNNPVSYNGYSYPSGHDEPSLLFYSSKPGSGNSNLYNLTLPTDPSTPPAQNGSGGTFSFMLHPAFWFGMALCDDQSAPDPGKSCPANSDKNIYKSTNPNSADYLGLTPGTAFLEMQFYPPGWGGVGTGVSCGPNNFQWCAALNIDSFSSNSNTGVPNNSDCLNAAGEEYVNYAIITKSGVPNGPPDPLNQTAATFQTTPDTLEMNSGDKLTVDMHDTPAGLQIVINDLTTGQSGSMTASTANGFGHPLYQPNSSTCTDQSYAFHPMYSTSSPDTRVLWAAHSYNVAFSDEIGHFEYCNALNSVQGSSCKASSFPDPTDSSKDSDDRGCYNLPVLDGTGAPIIPSFIGCLASDGDFDGPEYQAGTWPGSPGADPSKVSTPIQFSSPLFTGPGNSGPSNYRQAAFETNLPRIEGSDSSPNNNCQRHVYNPMDPSPGSGCIPLPNGATFYPIYSTTTDSNGSCLWQEGGGSIPGTVDNFGGTSAAEYGGLQEQIYPAPGFTTQGIYETFHNTLGNNPCPAPGGKGG